MNFQRLPHLLAVVVTAGIATSASAQSDYQRTGNQPALLDPFEHSAYFEVGVFHRSETVLGVDTATTFLPMRIGAEVLAMRHLQIRSQFGIAGATVKTSSALGDTRDRAFHPGNLLLGGFYTFGNAESGPDEAEWTLGAGGAVALPTSQNPDPDQAAAHIGAQRVHGVEDRWLFMPETLTIVPGVYGRLAFGPLFANLDLDMGFAIPTDDSDPTHTLQVRAEAGWRVETDLRLGVGITEVLEVGGDGSGDRSQAALRVFFRADLKILTFGTELVMNLDDPNGWAFDDGYWGVVTRVGLSL